MNLRSVCAISKTLSKIKEKKVNLENVKFTEGWLKRDAPPWVLVTKYAISVMAQASSRFIK